MRWTGISAGIGAALIVSMLIAGALGLGSAVRHHVIAPPELDLHIGGFRILAVIVSSAQSLAVAGAGPQRVSPACPVTGICTVRPVSLACNSQAVLSSRRPVERD